MSTTGVEYAGFNAKVRDVSIEIKAFIESKGFR